ncbi:MAG TPA: hypothetical protein VM617_00080 [Thermoanaerobaculia bacterium]|nr:hypothetical protein [Thermoanaerobaculia bacterium]
MSDQKYRQRGYRDEGRSNGDGPRERRQQGPPPQREGPRGRGLGAPTTSVFRCGDCGRRVSRAGGIEITQVCPNCEADLHTCVNCIHFDPSARFQCRQEIPAPVAKKRKRNECTLFAPKQVMEFESESGERTPDEARAAFDDLFADL